MRLTDKYRRLTRYRDHARRALLLEEQRELYNAAPQERMDCSKKTGTSVSYSAQCQSLTVCRREHPELAARPVTLQRGTLRRLATAFKHFFRQGKQKAKPGFPRFPGKGWYDGGVHQSKWPFAITPDPAREVENWAAHESNKKDKP